MSTIVTRAGKGSALTYNEVDSNFTNLNTDKYQSGGALGTPASGNLANCTFPTLNQDTTGNAGTVTNGVYTTGDQTINGTKTFSSTIVGSVNGNATTVTDGVYTSDIGTTVQAHSANLDQFATVNPTAAGLALLDDADAAAQRTTLGLGTAATTASTDYATAAQGTKADSALQSSAIGSTVQAYDSNLTSFVNTFTLPTTDGTSGQSLVTNGSGTLSFSSAGAGTVTSVNMTVPTGLSVSGNPVTTSGTLAVAYASGYAIPTTAKQTEWDSAYTQRLQWDGGATNLVAITGRASLLPSYASNAGKVLAVNVGATDVEWISVGGSGTVTSVSGTGTVNGITLTGTVTSAGSLTLGGSLDLSSPPAIGATTPSSITGTTITGTSLNVSNNTSSDAVTITQTGTGNALVVEDSTNPDSTPFVINNSGNVGIGTSSPATLLNVYSATSSIASIDGDSATTLRVVRYSNDTSSLNFQLRKARGTLASPSAVASGDQSGLIDFGAYGGSNFRGIARINAFVDTYTSDTNISGFLTFMTNGGATTPTERMRIDSSGNVGIGTTTTGSRLRTTQSSTTAYSFIAQTPIVGLTTGDYVNMAYFTNSRGDASNDGLRIVNLRDSTGSGIGNWETESYRIRRSVDANDGSSGVQEEIIFGNNTLGFSAGGQERIRITSTGNVGIGTTNPTVKLDVIGSIEASAAATQDAIILAGRAGGTSSFAATLTPTTLTASRTITLPDATTTMVGTDTAQTLTNKTLTSPTMIGTLIEDVFTITDGAGFAIDPDNGSIQTITLGANRTPTVANFAAGEAVTLMINDGTAYTITWTTIGVVWVGGTAPTLATTGFTVIELWRVGSTYYGALVGNVA